MLSLYQRLRDWQRQPEADADRSQTHLRQDEVTGSVPARGTAREAADTPRQEPARPPVRAGTGISTPSVAYSRDRCSEVRP